MPTGQAENRITWTDASERHLLLVILAVANPKGMDWKEIAARFGNGLSASAASQKYGKIKRSDTDLFPAADETSTPTFSSKKQSTAAITPTSTGKRGRGKGTIDSNPESYSDESPLKRKKEDKKKADITKAPVFKTEPDVPLKGYDPLASESDDGI